ncbi:MAG: DAK2 domain-containing protein [Oscillospiraceae bacterium]
MKLSAKQFSDMLKNACESVISAQDELTEIDSRFGDADHGVTMTKIAQAILTSLGEGGAAIKTTLDDAAMAVMMINGGSAVPLWNTYLDGLMEGAPSGDSLDEQQLKAMFKHGAEMLSALSKAKVGDKTMMDALLPATDALLAADGSIADIMNAAAEAAIAGAEATRGFVSKFGRARSYGEQTLGTPDAGAISMKYFFVGLRKDIL